jgi:predicted RNA-binding protein
MCESNVYIRNEAEDKLVMEDVAQLKDHDGKIWIVDLLGEEKEIEGKVQEISFLDHKVFISPKNL